MEVPRPVVENQAADLPCGVEGVEPHHAVCQVHPGQAGGVNLPCGGLAIGVQNLHIGGQGVRTHRAPVGAHPPGEGGAARQLDVHPGRGEVNLHQVAHGQAPALVLPLVSVALPVGGGEGECVRHKALTLGVLVGPGAQSGDDAVDGVGRSARGAHSGHPSGAAQQERDHIPSTEGAQVRQRKGRRCALNGIALSVQGDSGGCGGAGGEALDGPRGLPGISPDRAHGLGPVDNITGLDGRSCAGGARPVDLGPAHVEGQAGLPAPLGHQGPLHGGIDEGHPVDLPGGGKWVPQGGQVDLPALILGSEEVIKEPKGVPPGHGLALVQGDVLV